MSLYSDSIAFVDAVCVGLRYTKSRLQHKARGPTVRPIADGVVARVLPCGRVLKGHASDLFKEQ